MWYLHIMRRIAIFLTTLIGITSLASAVAAEFSLDTSGPRLCFLEAESNYCLGMSAVDFERLFGPAEVKTDRKDGGVDYLYRTDGIWAVTRSGTVDAFGFHVIPFGKDSAVGQLQIKAGPILKSTTSLRELSKVLGPYKETVELSLLNMTIYRWVVNEQVLNAIYTDGKLDEITFASPALK